jgi:transcriptional regulator with XRE-family HTH domain
MNKETIAQRLRLFRETKKSTATEMANFLGISVPGYTGYETGRRNLPLKYASILCDIGCNLNWLIANVGNMELEQSETKNEEKERKQIESLVEMNRDSIKLNLISAQSLENSTGTNFNLSSAIKNFSAMENHMKIKCEKCGNLDVSIDTIESTQTAYMLQKIE